MKKEDMKVEYINIDKIKPNEYNPKKMTQKEAEELESSIEKFGIVDPMIMNKAKERKGILIGGHQRLKIYKKMGFTRIPIVWVNIPDIEKERELCLRLSKNVGSWDWDLLANFDEDLLLDVGFDNDELEIRFNIMADPEEDSYDIEKAVKEKRIPTSKPGEMW